MSIISLILPTLQVFYLLKELILRKSYLIFSTRFFLLKETFFIADCINILLLHMGFLKDFIYLFRERERACARGEW